MPKAQIAEVPGDIEMKDLSPTAVVAAPASSNMNLIVGICIVIIIVIVVGSLIAWSFREVSRNNKTPAPVNNVITPTPNTTSVSTGVIILSVVIILVFIIMFGIGMYVVSTSKSK